MYWLSRIQAKLDDSIEYTVRKQDPRYSQNQIRHRVTLTKGVKLEGNCQIEAEAALIGNVSIGSYTLIGLRNIIYGGEISIGRYCQFAPDVSVYAHNHSMNTISTYNNKRLFDGQLKDLDQQRPVLIGNDVWVGNGAKILPGISIGSGVIIGAGSVVTKDVPDYVIIAGNPARIIRQRFSTELTELLLKWEWWHLTPDELLKFKRIFFMDISGGEEEIIKAIYEALASMGVEDS